MHWEPHNLIRKQTYYSESIIDYINNYRLIKLSKVLIMKLKVNVVRAKMI